MLTRSRRRETGDININNVTVSLVVCTVSLQYVVIRKVFANYLTEIFIYITYINFY